MLIPGALLALLEPVTKIGKCLSLFPSFFFILRARKLRKLSDENLSQAQQLFPAVQLHLVMAEGGHI